MNHDHHDCDHALKYCRHCAVVYCTACKAEWMRTSYWTYYPKATYTTSGYAVSDNVFANGAVVTLSSNTADNFGVKYPDGSAAEQLDAIKVEHSHT